MRNFNALLDRRVASTALILGLGTAVLAGCGTEYTVSGTVHKGANGIEYVIPNDAHQAVYKNKADCEADVQAHEAQIKKATGAEVKPSDVCQPVTKFHPVVYPRGYYYGVMTSGQQEWNSTRVITWSPVRDGQFAANGEALQRDVAQAPDGATEGEHTSVNEHEGGIFSDTGGDGGVHGGGGGEAPDVHPIVVDR